MACACSAFRPGRSALGGGCGAGVVDLDLFLADLAGDGFLVGDGFGAEPDPFDRDRFGGHDGAFGVQHDFVFFLGDRPRRTVRRRGWRR